MDSLQFAILVIIHQVSQAGGAVNITFDGNGYIGQSIVLQCKTDAASIVTPSAVWYFNNNVLLSTSSGRYTEIRTSDGFNLTVSDLTTADEGYYRCRIDFGSSSNKTLGILYNTSIHITDNPSTLTVTITIIAYPAPTYDVILRENGTKINVLWNSTNITLSNGAINITQINWSTLNKADYSLTVNVTSPVAAFQLYLVKFAPTPDPVTTPPPATTTTERKTTQTLGTTSLVTTSTTEINRTTTQTLVTTALVTTSTTDNNGTDNQQLLVIIGASVGGSVLIVVIIVIVIHCIRRRNKGRDSRKDSKYGTELEHSNHNQAADSHARVKDGTPNPPYQVSNVSNECCTSDIVPSSTSQEWNDSFQEGHEVTKSKPKKETSKAQMQSRTHSSYQTSASLQDSKDKPLPKKNEDGETKHVKQETTNL